MIECDQFIFDGKGKGGYGFPAFTMKIDAELENEFRKYGLPKISPLEVIETRMFEIKPGLLCFTRIKEELVDKPKYYAHSILIRKEDFDKLKRNVKILEKQTFYHLTTKEFMQGKKYDLDKIKIAENESEELSIDFRKINDIFKDKELLLVSLVDSILHLSKRKEEEKILIIMDRNSQERLDFFLNLLQCLPEKDRFVPFSTLSVDENDWDMFDVIIMSKLEERLRKRENVKVYNLDTPTKNAHGTPLKVAKHHVELIYAENIRELMEFHMSLSDLWNEINNVLNEINNEELSISESDMVFACLKCEKLEGYERFKNCTWKSSKKYIGNRYLHCLKNFINGNSYTIEDLAILNKLDGKSTDLEKFLRELISLSPNEIYWVVNEIVNKSDCTPFVKMKIIKSISGKLDPKKFESYETLMKELKKYFIPGKDEIDNLLSEYPCRLPELKDETSIEIVRENAEVFLKGIKLYLEKDFGETYNYKQPYFRSSIMRILENYKEVAKDIKPSYKRLVCISNFIVEFCKETKIDSSKEINDIDKVLDKLIRANIRRIYGAYNARVIEKEQGEKFLKGFNNICAKLAENNFTNLKILQQDIAILI